MKLHPPNPVGIDWATAIDLLTKAELNLDRPNHDQLAEVLNLVKQKPPQKDTQKLRDRNKGASGASGAPGSNADKKGQQGPAAADPLDTFEYGQNPSMDATAEQKKEARENRACTNCLKHHRD